MGAQKRHIQCPIPVEEYPRVLLAHGGGGSLMHGLIEKMFLAAFDNEYLNRRTDAVTLEMPSGKPVFTTDSFVVKPLFFPGGNIGSLAVHGTVNDLATSGAQPLYLSAGFILEEGLEMAVLWQIVMSMSEAARGCGVKIVTGDTKVVERGKGDGIFINTAGVGVVNPGCEIHPGRIESGNVVMVNGDVGRHGVAVMAAREELGFKTEIKSDSAPLAELVRELLEAGIDIHCLRDITRGGLAGVLNELAESAGVTIAVNEDKIPVENSVRAFCEVIGLDPLYSACEGRMVIIISEKDADRALSVLKKNSEGKDAQIIGRVRKRTSPIVTLKTILGNERVLPVLSGEQLPRIC